MFVFELPEIGEGVVEGEVVQWLVAEGDQIQRDQPLCEIMTDKATVEISSPTSGKVVKLHGSPGDIVAVHSPLADIDDGQANGAPAPTKAAKPTPAPAPTAAPAPARPAPTPAPTPARAPAPAVARDPDAKTLATPAVRSHARDLGLDIDGVPGSGKDGRVTRSDLDAFAGQAAHARAPVAVPPPLAVTGQDERIKIIGMRRKIAQKMAESYRLVPHFTYVDEVDAARLVRLRRRLKDQANAHGVKLTYMAFIAKALSMVFREFPTANANMNEEDFELIVRASHNIGIATDTPSGLMVPVVKDVQSKSILQIAADIADVTARARMGQARLDELQGGSFTITSVGNIGGRFATPIINHPEVAILGVNQIHERPVVKDGEIVIRPMMYLSPSFDHRVIDGAVAARFVSALKDVLEHPERMLLELR